MSEKKNEYFKDANFLEIKIQDIRDCTPGECERRNDV